MKTNGGFLVTKIKQLGDRIFEKILSEKNIDAFNGAQGRILYVLWQEESLHRLNKIFPSPDSSRCSSSVIKGFRRSPRKILGFSRVSGIT